MLNGMKSDSTLLSTSEHAAPADGQVGQAVVAGGRVGRGEELGGGEEDVRAAPGSHVAARHQSHHPLRPRHALQSTSEQDTNHINSHKSLFVKTETTSHLAFITLHCCLM